MVDVAQAGGSFPARDRAGPAGPASESAPDPFDSGGASADAGEVRALQIATLARHTPVNTAVPLVTAAILAVALWDGAPAAWILLWLGVIWANGLWHFSRWWRRRGRPAPRTVTVRTLRRAIVSATLAGAVWGATALMFPMISDVHMLLMAVVICAMGAGASTTLGAVPAAAAGFILAAVLPWILFFLLNGEGDYTVLAGVSVVYTLAMLASTRAVHLSFLESMRARRTNETLLARHEEAQATWLRISDSAEAFALFDRDDRLVLWNEGYRRLLSLPEEALSRGAPRGEVLRRAAGPAATDKGELLPEQWLARQMSLPERPDAAFVHRLASRRWLSSSAHRTADGYLVTRHLDVTEQKRREEALAESESRLKAFMDHSPVEMAIKDLDGRYLVVNRQFEQLYDVDGATIQGKTSADLFPPEVARSLSEHDAMVLRQRRIVEREETIPLEDGVYAFLAVKFPLFDAAGALSAIGSVAIDITERKKAFDALRESEKRVQDFAEASADWFWEMDADLRFTFMSPNVERLLNRSPEAFYGKTREELIGDGLPEGVLEDHLRTLRAHEPYREFVYPLKPDAHGKVRWLRTGGVPIFDEEGRFQGYRGSGSDVTRAVEAEQAVKNSEAQLRLVTDSLPVSIAYVGRGGQVLFANRSCCAWHARPPDQIVGRSFESLLGERSRRYRAHFEAVFSGKTASFEDRVLYGDGKTREIEATWVPSLGETGEVAAFLALALDVSDRKAAERALREREARLHELQRQLDHAFRINAMGQLSSALAHELNQPLTAITNYIQAGRRLMRSGKAAAPDKVDAVLDKAVEQSARAGDVIRRLRALFERGETEAAPHCINEVVQDAASLALLDATAQGIVSKWNLSPDLPRPIIDRIQIQQVVVNLVRNAVEALEGAEQREIVIETSRDMEGGVRVAVLDSGDGLPDGILDRLFDPFVGDKRNSMGVGLSISDRIVRAHGGKLSAERDAGGWTRVAFTLPAGEDEVASA